jgi:polysaccharide export outer membrane protein
MKRTPLGLLVLLLGFAPAAPAWAQTPARQANAGNIPQLPGTRAQETPNYVIQPNDVLRIFVWKDETLSQQRTLVRPDGRISLPLVQDIQAAGLHPGQLKQRLEERFKEWVDVPNVTVIVDTIQSYEIYVMGNVANPGIVRSATPLTILQALGTAGGFREFAKKNGVTIIRGKDRMRFNFDEFIDGRAPNENITLLSGDVVWVP